MELNPQDEKEDMKRRQDLQAKLQEAIRRSASASEIRNIQADIEKLNKKIEAYVTRVKR